MVDKFQTRQKIASWLNSKGYSFEFDKDGLWQEDFDFQEHKTKDVLDLISDFEKSQKSQMLKTMLNKNTIDRELYNYYYQKFVNS